MKLCFYTGLGLHFYIVFLVEEHTKADIFISKLYSMTRISYLRSYPENVEEDTKAVIFIYKKLRFLSQTIVAMAGILDRRSVDSGDRVADNQEAAKLE
ncbi:hypothetical protein D0Y65_048849 [Glycine soja]|uniref:Uncharacterized protein n=1 Tax=Glycine soja TaxID=3848 RepID=A0A445FUI7_GLYSO|nr:hypothetical protein D0Y65_048849 [Glycine soja]